MLKIMPDQNLWRNVMKYQADNCVNDILDDIINQQKNESQKQFFKGYDNIKDPSWPVLDSVDDWYNLPDYIKKECVTVHKFSPEIFCKRANDSNYFNPTKESIFEHIMQDNYSQTGSCYAHEHVNKVKNIVYNNLNFIQNQNVVELAGGNGLIGISCLRHGAKSLTYNDLSTWNVNSFEYATKVFNLEKPIKIIKADLNNSSIIKNIIAQNSVVIINHFLPLLEDPIKFLQQVANCLPKTIILSGRCSIHKNAQPMISREYSHLFNCEINPQYVEKNYNPTQKILTETITESMIIDCLKQNSYSVKNSFNWIQTPGDQKIRYTIILNRVPD